jgi:2-haloacid dehalogenase
MHLLNTVIFDLGGVLIDWNPRYLYRKIFNSDEEIEWFLKNICTSDWNEELDAGRSFEEATKELAEQHPQYAEAIFAWHHRWPETLKGEIADTVEILKNIKQKNHHRLYALTNWSHEKFPYALQRFEFLHWFEGIVVSGEEKTRKPYPEFYKILFDRYQVDPTRTVFIDDSLRNIEAGRALGMHGVHFKSPQDLKFELKKMSVL